MAIRESSYGYWSSGSAFVVVATAAALGIGNVTSLPTLAASHGGAVFLMVWLLALGAMTWPLVSAELALGRWCRDAVAGGIERAVLAAGAARAWRAVGVLMLASAVLVLSYAGVVGGWVMAYVPRAAAGVVHGQDTQALREQFLHVVGDPERSLAWHTLFMLLACMIVGHGLRDGVERACRYLLAGALLALLVLLQLSSTGDGDGAALAAMFRPDPAALGWGGAVEAVRSAFFAVPAGLAVMYTLGTCMPARWSPTVAGGAVAGLTAGFAILSAVWVLGLGHAGSSTAMDLIFRRLPAALPAGAGGHAGALALYLLLLCVSLGTAVGLLEVVTRHTMERWRTTRVFAATSAAVLVWALGLVSLLSFSVFSGVEPGGRSLFEWLQLLTAGWMVPLAALALAVLVSRAVPPGLCEEMYAGSRPRTVALQRWLLRYPVRVLILLMLLQQTGWIDTVVAFWRQP